MVVNNQDQVIKRFIDVHGDRYGYNKVVYQLNNVKVIINCSVHGDFPQTPASHLKGSGCPNCKNSTGEKLIQGLLKKMGIKYEIQKIFYGCMNHETGRMLPFDIYIPEFHTCIEYDGYHHYLSVEKWGGENKLIEVQRRDEIKNQYCKDNDINLIRISYTMDKLQIVNLFNERFNKNLIVDIKKRTKWFDVNIIDRVKDYKTREEFRIKNNTLWRYCYKQKMMDSVCENMLRIRNKYTYESAKEICEQYKDYTLFEKERSGLIHYIRKNSLFELVEHMDKKRYWTDEDILNELKGYEYKMDVRKNNEALYSVALKRGLIGILKDKTIHWNEEMVRDVFSKCKNKSEFKRRYNGAHCFAKKHGLYDKFVLIMNTP
jgi:hypothetical protein